MNNRLSIATLFGTIPLMLSSAPLRLAISLGIIISLGASIPVILLHQNISTAQELKNKKKVPPPPAPPSKGVPGNRTVSASMSGNSCDLNLVALAPQFNPDKSTEKSVWGQTTASYPTFWFFIPATSPSTQLEFSLQNEAGKDIYRTNIPVPSQAGVIGVQIPSSSPALAANQKYIWTFNAQVKCETSKSTRVHVNGWVTRVNLPGVISQKNKSEIYAQKGIWYDAVTSLAQQRLQNPQDRQLLEDWSDLLGSANLKGISQQPLIK
jgi:hypothetical protein